MGLVVDFQIVTPVNLVLDLVPLLLDPSCDRLAESLVVHALDSLGRGDQERHD